MNWEYIFKLSSQGNKNLKIFIVVSLLACAITVDSLIGAVPDFLQDRIVSGSGITLFILIAASYVMGQYFILKFIKDATIEIRSKSHILNATHRIVAVVQYTLVTIFLFVIFEILITKQYHVNQPNHCNHR